MRRAYRHNGPCVCMSLGSGRSLRPGAPVELDVESTPEWSAARKWIAKGWLVPVESDAPSDTSDDDELELLTVAELRDLADARGVELPSRCRKAHIIERLTNGGS